jgi:threonine aldolase
MIASPRFGLLKAWPSYFPQRVETSAASTAHLEYQRDNALARRGVLALIKGRRIRFVTHAQVDEASVDAAIAAMTDIRSTT